MKKYKFNSPYIVDVKLKCFKQAFNLVLEFLFRFSLGYTY